MQLCKYDRIICMNSQFIDIDYFFNHNEFERKLKETMKDDYDLLENGVDGNKFNCKQLRLCIIGLYIINEMKLNDETGTYNYDDLERNFLHVMVPCYEAEEETELKEFFEEFDSEQHDCFSEAHYETVLGKLICVAVKRYMEILKDEIKIFSISYDLKQFIQEQKKCFYKSIENKKEKEKFEKKVS